MLLLYRNNSFIRFSFFFSSFFFLSFFFFAFISHSLWKFINVRFHLTVHWIFIMLKSKIMLMLNFFFPIHLLQLRMVNLPIFHYIGVCTYRITCVREYRTEQTTRVYGIICTVAVYLQIPNSRVTQYTKID